MANGLIDYCICIEMVGFAIAHSFTFTYKEYLPATVEEAISAYEQVQQGESHDASGDNDGGEMLAPAYHPPETLARPMRVRDAFWSSTLPSETLKDIRRLQNGVDRAVNQINDPGTISLQSMPAVGEDGDGGVNNYQPIPQMHVV